MGAVEDGRGGGQKTLNGKSNGKNVEDSAVHVGEVEATFLVFTCVNLI